MSKEIELNYFGKVNDGKLHIVHRNRFDSDLHFLEGKEVSITVKKKRKTRSNAQNAFYWLLIGLIVERLNELGHQIKLADGQEWMREVLLKTNKDLIHANFKDLFIENIEVDTETGEITKKHKSTRTMTTTEFMEYLEPIYQYAAEKLSLVLPTPDNDYNTMP